jgi:cyd operon protein YbgT
MLTAPIDYWDTKDSYAKHPYGLRSRRYALTVQEEIFMWYFTWILGVGFAVLLAILNAMWGEHALARNDSHRSDPASADTHGSHP